MGRLIRKMRWALLASALGLVLLGCAGLALGLQQQALGPLVLPGATRLSSSWQGSGSLLVRYETSGEPFGWRGQLAHQLEKAGWQGHSFSNVGAKRPPFVTIWYSHEWRLGPVLISERAIFGGNPDLPNLAIVELNRDLYVAGRPLLAP